MKLLKRLAIGLGIASCSLLLLDLAYIKVFGQTPAQSLTVVLYSSITSASRLDGCDPTPNPCIDNRSQFIRQSSISSFRAIGIGTWSVDMQWADVTPTVWSSFGSTAQVNQAGPASGVGYGIGPSFAAKPYHDFIRFVITGNATILNYNGTRQFWWLPSVATIAFPITLNQGGIAGLLYVDQFAGTFSNACTNANSLSEPLFVTRPTATLSTQACAPPITFLPGSNSSNGGKLVVGSGQSVTINSNFTCGTHQQCFDLSASGSLITFSGAPPYLNANWFGADWTGAVDSLAALNACVAASAGCFVPGGGVYHVSGPLIIAQNNTTFTCGPGTSIVSTAVGSVDSTVTIGPAERIRFEGCLVRGTATGTVARAVHVNACNNCVIRNIDAKDAVTLFYINNSVTVLLDNPGGSPASGAMLFEPSYGIDLVADNLVKIVNARIENIAYSKRSAGYPGGVGVGIRIRGTTMPEQGTVATSIDGGTSESNNIAVKIDNLSYGTVITSLDSEDDCDSDVEDGGLSNLIVGGLLAGGSYSGSCVGAANTSIHYTSTANQSMAIGTVSSNINVDSGAKNLSIMSNNMGNSACTGNVTWCGTEAGTDTYRINNKSCCGAGSMLFTNKIPGTITIGKTGAITSIIGQLTQDILPNSNLTNNGSVNFALNYTLTRLDGAMVPVVPGLEVNIISLPVNLQAGVNTLTLNGVGPFQIKNSFGGNLTGVYVSSLPLTLTLAGSLWFVKGGQ